MSKASETLFQAVRRAWCWVFGHRITGHAPWGAWCQRCQRTIHD